MCVCFVVVVIGVVVAVVVLSYDTLSLYLLFRNTGRNQRNEFVKAAWSVGAGYQFSFAHCN